MNYGSEPADQVVRYSLEGAEFALRISGTAAKNFFIFAQAVLHDSKKTHGKTHLIRLLKEQKPLKFFTVDKDRMHDFARAAKAHGLLFCPIRDKMDPDHIEIAILQDDASKEINKEETNNVSNPIRAAGQRAEYRALLLKNIEYPILAQNNPMDTMRLDELVELMLDVVCSRRAAIRISGEEMPAEVVKSRFLKLGAEHIQYVLDCLKDNPPRIRNIKQYLLAALYNAPLTIENYYAAQIDHDLCGGKRWGTPKSLLLRHCHSTPYPSRSSVLRIVANVRPPS